MATGSEHADVLELLNRPSPHDIVAAIVAYSNLDTFASDRRRIHDFIRGRREEPEFHDLLSPFVFSEGADTYPFSRTLENTIVHLQLGGVIFAKNPEFDRLGMIKEARERTIRKAASRFDEESLRKLKRVAEAFAAALGD